MIRKLQERYPWLDPIHVRKQIRHRARPLLAKVDAQPHRIRLISVVLAVSLIWALTEKVFLEPNDARAKTVASAIERTGISIKQLNDEAQAIEENHTIDPDADVKAELEEVKAHLVKLDEQLRELTVGLISPVEMAQLLEDMLSEESNLVLESLETLPAEPVVKSLVEVDQGREKTERYYRHAVVLTLRGGYFSTLHYLELLEQLPWDFFWDELDYEVTEYPEARVTLRLHTLGSGAGWIGV